MSFAHPGWLNALFAVPVLVVLFLVGAKRRRTALAEFAGEKLSASLAPGRSWRKGLAKTVLRTAGYALVVVALAGPQFGSHLVKIEREGIDLVIALDTSLSMLAEDMRPNRLEKTTIETKTFTSYTDKYALFAIPALFLLALELALAESVLREVP